MDCSSWLNVGLGIGCQGVGFAKSLLYVGCLGRGRLRRDCITDVVGCVTRVLLAGAVQRGVVRYARSPLVGRCVLVYGMYCSAMSLSFAPEGRLNVGRRQRNLVSLFCG